MPKCLISVLSLHRSAERDVGVVPDQTTGITALEIEELFSQETLFVPVFSNWQSVSGFLEPTSKEKQQDWEGIWASVTPRLERACMTMGYPLCGFHAWTTLSDLHKHWPNLPCHYWSTSLLSADHGRGRFLPVTLVASPLIFWHVPGLKSLFCMKRCGLGPKDLVWNGL